MFEFISTIQTQIPTPENVIWYQHPIGIASLLAVAAVLAIGAGILRARARRRPGFDGDLSVALFSIAATGMAFGLDWFRPLAMTLYLFSFVGLSVVAGNWLARQLKSPDYGWRLGLIFAVLSVSGLAIAESWPPRFGVDLRGGITIIGQLRQDTEQTETVDVKTMIPQLIARVDPSGIQEILIRALGTDKIEVVIPDVDMEEAMRIWKRLTQAGELKFRIVADLNYHASLTARAAELTSAGVRDSIVREKTTNPTENQSGKIVGRWYELGRVDPSEAINGTIPFKFMPLVSHLVRDGKTKQPINVESFSGSPVELAKWADKQKTTKVEILCLEPEGRDDILNVEGEHLRGASSGSDENGRPAVHFQMSRDGKRRMGALTSRNRAEGNRVKLLAIISDGKLITAPSINSTITDRGIIEGRFAQKEVDDLVINLKAGKLEVALSENPISQDYQQSTIGEELKQRGIMSCLVSLGVVVVFMCFYYRFGGLVASVVLALNVVLVMAIVMLIKQPLTLTGLAGIVLTIGMSVDANVLIFERIREELKKGAALRMAIRNGYDRAMTTIIDANLTTLLTGVVLYVIGTEQLKGFSVTLILGILTSMFTAIFCSRVMIELAERRKWITELKMLSVFGGGVIDFVGRRRTWYAVSLSAIAIGLLGTYFRGSEILDNDLRGGSTARIVMDADANLDVAQVRQMLSQYNGRINDRENAHFAVAAITSQEYPGRVFKVDSNIPIWDKPEAAPFKPIDQAIVDVFGNKLMQLRVDYDPSRLQVSKVVVQPEVKLDDPTNPTPSSQGQPGSVDAPAKESSQTIRFPWTAGLAVMAQPFGLVLLQESEVAEQSGGQDTKAVDQIDSPAAQESTSAPETAPKDPQAISTPIGSQPQISSADRFVATTELTFGQQISRGSLINALVSAAEQTNQVVLEPTDVTASTSGANADDLSVKSNVWQVNFNIVRESDAKLVLDALQAGYNDKPYFPTISGVGGQIAAQTQWRALAAILASLIGIVMYVWVRFQNVAFGLGAVIALAHDVLITLGAVALSFWLAPYLGILQVENFRISLPMIAAFLTLIGYSINDTIVVFDRIREVRGKRPELTAEMINNSVSQTLSRTILTSTLTLMAVLVLFFMGGESIHGFAFALVVGIIVGTYSSIFIASPISLWLITRSLRPKSATKMN